MIKKKKRYCDACKNEIPMELDLTKPDINPHDIISLGFRKGNGKVMNKSLDLCQGCMNKVDKVLNGEVN